MLHPEAVFTNFGTVTKSSSEGALEEADRWRIAALNLDPWMVEEAEAIADGLSSL